MRKWFVVLAILQTVFSCQRKSVPVLTERKSIEIKRKSTELPANFKANTILGKELFMANCQRCHGLPSPEFYSVKRWETILIAMAPKARLSTEQSAHILSFVSKTAKEY